MQPGITLDRDVEPWRGEFPGLGQVEIAADGAVVVCAEPGIESSDLRADALRHGWGEPLSWVRRGYRLLSGGTASPDPFRGCLLLCGDLHEFGRLVAPLTEAGWAFGSDRYTPTEWAPRRLLAHPVAAPILLSQRRAARGSLAAEPVRADTDTVAVAVPRIEEPSPIVGVVSLGRARPGDTTFETLRGHRRFEVAGGLPCRGVLGGIADGRSATAEPAEQDPNDLAELLRLAQLPTAQLRLSGSGDRLPTEAAEVTAWWHEVTS